jgi:hypothetical protein
MRVTIFTRNQPRHLALVQRFSTIADTVYAVLECRSVVLKASEPESIMKHYSLRMRKAEIDMFGEIDFLPTNVHVLPVAANDISSLEVGILTDALESDVIIVFGASYIREPLAGALIENGAINIHMGISPYYRGSMCNFWALFDGQLDLVGATIHRLSRGLDSGNILFHVLPGDGDYGPFEFGMRAVDAAQRELLKHAACGDLDRCIDVAQDDNFLIRYSRAREFTEQVAQEFLDRYPNENSCIKVSGGRSKYRYVTI